MIPADKAIDIAVKVLQAEPFNFDESEAQRFAEAFKVALALGYFERTLAKE